MRHNYYRLGRQDNCKKEIADYLKFAQIEFVSLYPNQGADLLLFLQGGVVFVEVKTSDASPSRKKGTKTEQKYQQICRDRSIPYFIVSSVSELRALLVAARVDFGRSRGDSASL